MIHVDEQALIDLEKALDTAGAKYKADLDKLGKLIESITSGAITGDPAKDLLSKYQAKQDAFNELAKTIDEAKGYIEGQKNAFTNMIDDLKTGMQ